MSVEGYATCLTRNELPCLALARSLFNVPRHEGLCRDITEFLQYLRHTDFQARFTATRCISCISSVGSMKIVVMRHETLVMFAIVSSAESICVIGSPRQFQLSREISPFKRSSPTNCLPSYNFLISCLTGPLAKFEQLPYSFTSLQ